jgi:hypothetical protein
MLLTILKSAHKLVKKLVLGLTNWSHLSLGWVLPQANNAVLRPCSRREEKSGHDQANLHNPRMQAALQYPEGWYYSNSSRSQQYHKGAAEVNRKIKSSVKKVILQLFITIMIITPF